MYYWVLTSFIKSAIMISLFPLDFRTSFVYNVGTLGQTTGAWPTRHKQEDKMRLSVAYSVRFSHAQLAQLRAGAAATGRPVANFVRWAATRAAKEALQNSGPHGGALEKKQNGQAS